MRKADYVALTAIIKKHNYVADAKIAQLQNPEYWAGYKAVLCIVADEFSDIASVKKEEFMRACGLES